MNGGGEYVCVGGGGGGGGVGTAGAKVAAKCRCLPRK